MQLASTYMSSKSGPKRVLAAPFQQWQNNGDSGDDQNAALSGFFTDDVVDFRSHEFKAVEPLKQMKFDTVSVVSSVVVPLLGDIFIFLYFNIAFSYCVNIQYCGPTPESNWVIPGVLLVGAYPASEDDNETFELLTAILQLGITKFVCLQSEVRCR